MAAATMERRAEVHGELNHSCTSQCPNPCPAARNQTGRPPTAFPPPPTVFRVATRPLAG
ncbi:hypothetical protein GCM10018793_16420 [Streptomyces sulfonofaciens]|uniref:Uncharacterized protein n=1 Tax=Streptomyces sulfonofaciens TaxID=68272 RepID=A0A919KWM6_9ACTN|nr:hypothetical protein GCM10018793_16420 [Streptomyces sulfonofaciens]